MDTKRLILTMLLSMAIIFGWQLLVAQWYQRHPEAQRATTQPTTAPATTAGATPTTAATTQAVVLPTTVASTQSAPSLTAPALAAAPPTTRPSVITLGSSDQFNTRLNITTGGAAIQSVELKEFKAADGKPPFVYQTPYVVDRPDTHALALRTIHINGTPVDVSSAVWNRVDGDNVKFVRLSLDIHDNNGQPIIRIFRTYELAPKDAPSKGFDHTVTQTYENLTNQPITLKAVFNGPNQPPREIERSMDLALIAGYNDDNDVRVYSHPVEGFTKDKPTADLTTADGKFPLLWTGAASVYFNAIFRPEPANLIAKATADAINPDEPDTYQHKLRTTLETSDLKLEPGKSVQLAGTLYLGPRQRSLLNNKYYAAFPRSYDKTLVITHGPCGYCTFQWLIDILVRLLTFFHWVFGGFAGRGDWGLAIIALVFLVRALLHPITKRSQVSMMKMGKMGPEVERLKKKHGDNKDELNKAMMQLYKEQGFTPVLGCLPMFLQMPIWIALWSALQSTFELRQAPFLWGITWIDDLARPDQLFVFARPIPLLLFGWQLHAINLLPILMVGVTYMNNKLMPRPVAMSPEQEQQQKMMMWMTMLFPLMFYSFPSGLNLYYVTSMGLGIIESKIVRNHIKQKEEEEKAGKVIIDAPPTRGAKTRKHEKPAPVKKTGIAKWLADLQQKAEEIRKQADRKR